MGHLSNSDSHALLSQGARVPSQSSASQQKHSQAVDACFVESKCVAIIVQKHSPAHRNATSD